MHTDARYLQPDLSRCSLDDLLAYACDEGLIRGPRLTPGGDYYDGDDSDGRRIAIETVGGVPVELSPNRAIRWLRATISAYIQATGRLSRPDLTAPPPPDC